MCSWAGPGLAHAAAGTRSGTRSHLLTGCGAMRVSSCAARPQGLPEAGDGKMLLQPAERGARVALQQAVRLDEAQRGASTLPGRPRLRQHISSAARAVRVHCSQTPPRPAAAVAAAAAAAEAAPLPWPAWIHCVGRQSLRARQRQAWHHGGPTCGCWPKKKSSCVPALPARSAAMHQGCPFCCSCSSWRPLAMASAQQAAAGVRAHGERLGPVQTASW